MNAVTIIIFILLAGIGIFALCKLGILESRIDDIYHKALTMQGEIEANTARAKDNYRLIAQVNTELERVKDIIAELHKQEPIDEPSQDVEEELENLVPKQEEEEKETISLSAYDIQFRRDHFAYLRKQGLDIKCAGESVGVSYSTAKRYEQWRKDNKK
jgi:hypothetical protein